MTCEAEVEQHLPRQASRDGAVHGETGGNKEGNAPMSTPKQAELSQAAMYVWVVTSHPHLIRRARALPRGPRERQGLRHEPLVAVCMDVDQSPNTEVMMLLRRRPRLISVNMSIATITNGTEQRTEHERPKRRRRRAGRVSVWAPPTTNVSLNIST